jgi:hypothetical protein
MHQFQCGCRGCQQSVEGEQSMEGGAKMRTGIARLLQSSAVHLVSRRQPAQLHTPSGPAFKPSRQRSRGSSKCEECFQTSSPSLPFSRLLGNWGGSAFMNYGLNILELFQVDNVFKSFVKNFMKKIQSKKVKQK